MNKRGQYLMTRSVQLLAIAFLMTMMCGPLCSSIDARSSKELAEFSETFTQAANKVSPSVVNVRTSQEVTISGTRGFQGFPPDHPFAPFFEDLIPFLREYENRSQRGQDEQEEEPSQGLVPRGMGSGLIVSSDGYILTNNHVVAGADEIEVIVKQDGETKTYKVEEPPRTDELTDLAIIKIDASGLPVPTFGDSDKLEPGEWVLAIGSPFGLDHSVTSGIVSYVGREPGRIARFGTFIQTDAAINPGNSGGPLVNMDGEVVGINVAIATGGPMERSYAGVGFTIPINTVKMVKDALIEKGEVTRGYLGVYITNVTEQFAKHTGLESQKGALVQRVEDDSPAGQAGIGIKDVIVGVDGKSISSAADLQLTIAATEPGERVKVEVLRYDDDSWHEETFSVTIGKRPGEEEKAKEVSSAPAKELGMTVQNLTDELAERLDYEPGSGVVVTKVDRFGPAARAGIQRYDLIREVNQQDVSSVKEFNKAVKKHEDSALLVVERKGETFIVVIEFD